MSTETGAARRPMVRRVRASEWAALRDMRLRSLRIDPQAYGGTIADEVGLADTRWIDRATRSATSPTEGHWVAEVEGDRLVGGAVLVEVGGEVHLHAMWVDPDQRGVGLGGRLLDAALAWGDHAFPGRTVHLEVNPRQEAAVRLYSSRGFRRTGGRRPLGHLDGEWRIAMVRLPVP